MSTHDTFTTFHADSPMHALVLMVLVAICTVIVRGARAAHERGPGEVKRFERWFAATLLAIWFTTSLFDAMPARWKWGSSLPLHICDVVGLMAPVALLTRSRMLRSVVYFWGIGLCAQTFLMPTLVQGPLHVEFWYFWLAHSAIVAYAVYDLVILQFRPTWADWRRAVLAFSLYAFLVLPVDIRLGVNYGFMGKTNAGQPGAITALGSWPDRLPKMLLLVYGLMALLALPWFIADEKPSRLMESIEGGAASDRYMPASSF